MDKDELNVKGKNFRVQLTPLRIEPLFVRNVHSPEAAGSFSLDRPYLGDFRCFAASISLFAPFACGLTIPCAVRYDCCRINGGLVCWSLTRQGQRPRSTEGLSGASIASKRGKADGNLERQ